jgi:hypothetical protein
MQATQPIKPFRLWRTIPVIGKFIILGLLFISGIVVSDFVRLVGEPGPLKPGEDLYIHLALLILVPGAAFGMLLVAFGYAYYQECKHMHTRPFWKNLAG